jgi:hypothetical protein
MYVGILIAGIKDTLKAGAKCLSKNPMGGDFNPAPATTAAIDGAGFARRHSGLSVFSVKRTLPAPL